MICCISFSKRFTASFDMIIGGTSFKFGFVAAATLVFVGFIDGNDGDGEDADNVGNTGAGSDM